MWSAVMRGAARVSVRELLEQFLVGVARPPRALLGEGEALRPGPEAGLAHGVAQELARLVAGNQLLRWSRGSSMLTMSRPSRTGGGGGARASAIGSSTAALGGAAALRPAASGLRKVAMAGASAGARRSRRRALRVALAAGGAGDSWVRGCDGGGERVRRRAREPAPAPRLVGEREPAPRRAVE